MHYDNESQEPLLRLKLPRLRTPAHDGHDSEVMADTIPAA